MKKVQQAGLILLVVLVALSTTGITIRHHICACRSMQAAPVRTCCTPVPSPASCCGEHNTAPAKEDSEGCANHHKGCRDVPLYFKASIIALPLLKKSSFEFTMPSMDLPARVLLSEAPETPVAAIVIPSGDPPPLSGRERLIFMRQLRIPFIA